MRVLSLLFISGCLFLTQNLVALSKEIRISDLPTEVLKLYQADQNCQPLNRKTLPHAIEKENLGKGQQLYLLPCSSGAYNIFSKVFLKSHNEIEQLFFADYHSRQGWSGTDVLVNFGFNPKTKTLTSFNKSAGHGWCGSSGKWRWEEYYFEMIELQSWDDCLNDKAPEDWPYIYKKSKK